MTKPKSKDIGILPPAIFDLKTVSTPARSQSEANIDTKGYDPAWDEPNFGRTESPAVEGDAPTEPKPDTLTESLRERNGHEGSTIPENPGHPISFGKTLDALLGGGKSVTRRTWSRRHAEHFINRFDRGQNVRAFDKDRRGGGQLVGWLRLTQKPYRERLADMPSSDVAAEGFPELSKPEFIDRFFEGNADLTVWVIRFEFAPLEVEPERSPVQELLSPSANAEESLAPEPVVAEVVEPDVRVGVARPLDVACPQDNRPFGNSALPIPNSEGELSYEEERDRLHLERKVERAFYEAGRALRELRDRRLYRSTHKTFENYCRDRFGFTHRRINYLIAGSRVVENLQMGTNGSQTQENEKTGTNGSQIQNGTQGESLPDREMGTNSAQTGMGTNGSQILPTSERQIRPLAKLEPDRQREVWQQAVTEAGGKVPSGRIVKDIVERMQQVESPPESLPRAHHLTLEPGGLVEVSCPDREKIHARLGRIVAVKEKTVEVWLRDVKTMMMNKHTLKHHQVEAVPMEREPGLQELCDRFLALRERGLDPFELEVLALLERAVVLTPMEMGYLEGIEGRS